MCSRGCADNWDVRCCCEFNCGIKLIIDQYKAERDDMID